jgi:NADPH-dependent ferric siderophore reductase
MQCYAGTAKILTDYEDLNLAQYTDLDAHKLVINSPESANLKESMLHTLENLRNPFTDLYHWVKGELYDLSAMKIVLVERQKIATRMREL